MSLKEAAHEAIETMEDAGLQFLSDRETGKRLRSSYAKVIAQAKAQGIDEAVTRKAIISGVCLGNDAAKAAYAAKEAIDPANLALILNFIAQMAPMFMSACPAG